MIYDLPQERWYDIFAYAVPTSRDYQQVCLVCKVFRDMVQPGPAFYWQRLAHYLDNRVKASGAVTGIFLTQKLHHLEKEPAAICVENWKSKSKAYLASTQRGDSAARALLAADFERMLVASLAGRDAQLLSTLATEVNPTFPHIQAIAQQAKTALSGMLSIDVSYPSCWHVAGGYHKPNFLSNVNSKDFTEKNANSIKCHVVNVRIHSPFLERFQAQKGTLVLPLSMLRKKNEGDVVEFLYQEERALLICCQRQLGSEFQEVFKRVDEYLPALW